MQHVAHLHVFLHQVMECNTSCDAINQTVMPELRIAHNDK